MDIQLDKRLIVAIVALLVIAGAVAAYFVFLNEPAAGEATADASRTGTAAGESSPSEELYRQALAAAVDFPSTEEISGSFDVDSGDTRFKGEFIASPGNWDKGNIRGEVEIKSSIEGIPVIMAAELIAIEDGDRPDGYVKYMSVTSPDIAYKQQVEDFFAPALDKWTKMADDGDEDDGDGFDEDGAMAAMSLVDIFFPVSTLSSADREVFLSAVDSNDLYQVGEDIETTQYQGAAARKITVTIDKDTLLACDREINEAISEDADFESLDTDFIDQVFGDSDSLSADVYLSQDAASIIGVSLNLKLDPPIDETVFDTTLKKIKVNISILEDGQLTIEAPSSFITEKELDALMAG